MKLFTRLKVGWDIFIRDRHGHIVLWQRPNVWLIGWFVCRLAAFLLDARRLEALVGYLGTACLLVWACLEIIQGASYFRRVIGGIILLATIASYLR